MLVVQKYGGTSVGTVDRIREVAKRCMETQAEGHEVVVIVSAMSGETNRLIALAKQVNDEPDDRELDVIAATGEQVSVGLVSLAIQKLGGKAQSFLGSQVRIITDSAFTRARIKSIDAQKVFDALKLGKIAVVAGFQGIDDDGNITTLGRGGSDTSGVAIAAALKADACEIYTDVDGVYTTDPNICPNAKKIARISYEEMLELASLGAKVLQIRSVEFGMKYGVPIHVRSSFNHNEGTWVVPEEKQMEDVLVSGVAVDKNEAKVTLIGVPDKPGIAAKIFRPLSEANIVVDMIIQNISAEGRTDLTFTVPRSDLKKAVEMIKKAVPELAEGGIKTDDGIAKVSVVGVGMRSHAGVAQRTFEILASEGINILMISTSEIKISVVVDAKYAELAVRVLHDGFELGKILMDMMLWLKGAKQKLSLDVTSDFASMLATPDGKNELHQLARKLKVDLTPLIAFGGNAEKPKPRPRKQLLDVALALQAGWAKHGKKLAPYYSDQEFMQEYFPADLETLVDALQAKGDAKVYLWAAMH